jgi:hypothetical protein
MNVLCLVAKHASACVLMAVIASCGGGGGSGGVQAAPLPTLSEDTVPSGQRIDVSGRDYFALAAGGVWVFERTSEGLTFPQHNREVRTNGPAESPIFLIDGYPPSTTESFYRYTAEGLVSVNPLRNVQADYPAVAAALPSLLEFATPFYPQGGTRRLVRQGDAGADLDGDGRNERFRIEFTQVFLGFQAMQVMDVMTEVAGFRSTFAFTIYATRDQREVTSSSAEESYWGDGIGMVRATRSAVGPDGLPAFPTYTIRLTDASVGGLDLGPGSASSTSIPLPRRDLVYDSARSVYYATVGADDAINRNRLAVIDSSSGVTTFTREVGASPGTLALTADNSVLYVGLQGSGEVLKLALPSFQELARFRLPVEPFRRTQYLPEDLAASPTDPDLIAVSMYRPGTRFLRHSGILMARGMVPLPQRTSPLGDGNVLAFSSDGATLHSLQNECVTGGLHGLPIRPPRTEHRGRPDDDSEQRLDNGERADVLGRAERPPLLETARHTEDRLPASAEHAGCVRCTELAIAWHRSFRHQRQLNAMAPRAWACGTSGNHQRRGSPVVQRSPAALAAARKKQKAAGSTDPRFAQLVGVNPCANHRCRRSPHRS